mmetsp:Transcript_74184/g.119719  ORF Transcript_74184/g.119719 Transcript_74184/m.119719 type:complete len:92 (-) Transcript_74184:112-387(-)
MLACLRMPESVISLAGASPAKCQRLAYLVDCAPGRSNGKGPIVRCQEVFDGQFAVRQTGIGFPLGIEIDIGEVCKQLPLEEGGDCCEVGAG